MLIGLPNLYDRFLIARFIAVAVILAIVFLFALIRKKRWLAPNTAEALFTFSCQLLSPNYLYPHLNLAYIYLNEGQPQKAKAVVDGVYFDEHKRDVLKADAPYFEPFNTEAARQKIDADYEAFMQLKSSFLFSF